MVWALFNRFALFWYRKKPDLTSFLRAYSTVLQPVLNSAGAAQRHYLSADFKRTGGTYADRKHPEIPRGQLQRHLDLQARASEQLPEAARRLALAAMSGQIPSPVGLASEFASTRIYYKQHHGGQEPTDQQWREYTERLARQKKWVWVGDRPGLNQRKNAFFVDARAAAFARGSGPCRILLTIEAVTGKVPLRRHGADQAVEASRFVAASTAAIGTGQTKPAPQQFRPVTELLAPCQQSSQHAYS